MAVTIEARCATCGEVGAADSYATLGELGWRKDGHQWRCSDRCCSTVTMGTVAGLTLQALEANDLQLNARLSKLEGSVYRDRCPYLYDDWLRFLGERITPLVVHETLTSPSVMLFHGKPLKHCPFCGETLPHQEQP